MKGFSKFLMFSFATALIMQPILSFGAPARIVPNGSVALISDGKEVDRFRSEMPVPEGMLMACDGNCVVQTQSVQLVAQNKAVFALTTSSERMDVAVQTGRVEFAIRPDARLVAFRTPHDLLEAQQTIVPASSDALVRGYVQVTNGQTELTVQEGALRVATADGSHLVERGNSIVLAQAKITEQNKQEESKDKKAAVVTTESAAGAGATTLSAGTLGGLTTTSMVIGGVGIAGMAGVATYSAANQNNEDKPDKSPSAPTHPKPGM